MSEGKATTTEPVVLVLVLVRSYCPQCNRKIELQAALGEKSVEQTGNTTEMARYHIARMKESVAATLKSRGWTLEMCGRCKDKDA